ncbi:hypothetical protein FSARC_3953 [Fusarium sarcochroum]|uniref:Uncharacterized protein n=1 Tax=Fusarium sarcochroum TaxID=1208366 RepID=A0A8H4U2V4_9HYPO|nr:hypothetical protein FSARC_3953 [Fusarium sarcochroum]
MSSPQVELQVDHDVCFRHEVLEGFEKDIEDIATDKDKKDLLMSIQSFAFHFIKEPWKRPPADAEAVQQGLDVLWQLFLKAGTAIDSNSPFQDRLVLLLLWTKQFDVFHKDMHNARESADDWESYGFAKSLQASWEQLVVTGTTAQLCNLATFSAKTLSAGICPDQMCSTALWYLREVLEINDEARTTRLLPGAVVWMDLGRHALLKNCVSDEGDGQSKLYLLNAGPLAQDGGANVPGFSLKRWLFWRRRFQKLSHHADLSISDVARKGFMAMINCGRDLDYDILGEGRFAQKLQETMWAELVKSGKESLDGDEIDIDPDWVDEQY